MPPQAMKCPDCDGSGVNAEEECAGECSVCGDQNSHPALCKTCEGAMEIEE